MNSGAILNDAPLQEREKDKSARDTPYTETV